MHPLKLALTSRVCDERRSDERAALVPRAGQVGLGEVAVDERAAGGDEVDEVRAGEVAPLELAPVPHLAGEVGVAIVHARVNRTMLDAIGKADRGSRFAPPMRAGTHESLTFAGQSRSVGDGLVREVPGAGEVQRDAVFLGERDGLLVADRAARLDDRAHAGVDEHLRAVVEREERVGRGDRPGGPIAGARRRRACTSRPG